MPCKHLTTSVHYCVDCGSARCNLELGRVSLPQAARPLVAGQTVSADSEQLFQLALSDCVVASELLHRQGGGEGASAADLEVLQGDLIDALDTLAAARAADDAGGAGADGHSDEPHDWEDLEQAAALSGEIGIVPTTAPLQSTARVRVCEVLLPSRTPLCLATHLTVAV